MCTCGIAAGKCTQKGCIFICMHDVTQEGGCWSSAGGDRDLVDSEACLFRKGQFFLRLSRERGVGWKWLLQ